VKGLLGDQVADAPEQIPKMSSKRVNVLVYSGNVS
jgi:hypothetical protein